MKNKKKKLKGILFFFGLVGIPNMEATPSFLSLWNQAVYFVPRLGWSQLPTSSFNIAPENIPSQQRKWSSSHHFSLALRGWSFLVYRWAGFLVCFAVASFGVCDECPRKPDLDGCCRVKGNLASYFRGNSYTTPKKTSNNKQHEASIQKTGCSEFQDYIINL